jgi:hypothetical protein
MDLWLIVAAIVAALVLCAAVPILREVRSLSVDMRTGRAQHDASLGPPRLPSSQRLRSLARLRPLAKRRHPLPVAEEGASVSPHGVP